MDNQYYLGAHVTTYLGMIVALKEVKKSGGNLIQVFLSNPQGRGMRKRDQKEIDQIEQFVTKHKMKIVVHSPYILNFAREFDKKSWFIRGLIRELELDSKMGTMGSVIHFGNHMAFTEKQGFDNMYKSLKYIISKCPPNVKIFLETSAGQGTELGFKLEAFAKFYKRFSKKEKETLVICVDSCHIFAAGYDIRTKKGVKEYFKKFDQLIGLQYLQLIHLNDSQVPLGKRVDRHASLGEGFIGKTGLLEIAKFAYKHKIPTVLETPGTYSKEIPMIRKFLKV